MAEARKNTTVLVSIRSNIGSTVKLNYAVLRTSLSEYSIQNFEGILALPIRISELVVAPNVRLLCKGCGVDLRAGDIYYQQLAEVVAIGDASPSEYRRIICKRCFGEDWTAVTKQQP